MDKIREKINKANAVVPTIALAACQALCSSFSCLSLIKRGINPAEVEAFNKLPSWLGMYPHLCNKATGVNVNSFIDVIFDIDSRLK